MPEVVLLLERLWAQVKLQGRRVRDSLSLSGQLVSNGHILHIRTTTLIDTTRCAEA